MKFSFDNIIGSSFKSELPVFDNMDAYIDFILPKIKPYSESLEDQKLYVNKRWKEFRDDEDFHEAVLYIFQDDEVGSLLLSIDGNIGVGSWEVLPKSNTLILESGGKKQKSELFDLAFLNKDFLILKKHGNQKRINKKKYLVLGFEKSCGKLDWLDLMDKMYDLYRGNWLFTLMIILLLLVAGLLLFSIFM
ncbi:MAG TPA: hypothetical protein ENK85_12170 [Saprospiraceae bacterium]|nr:hypothetical protein [Saprospiraceae bacterium]